MRQERQVKSVILETIKKQKMLSAGILTAVIGAVVAALIPPLILAKIIDTVTAGNEAAFSVILLYFVLLWNLDKKDKTENLVRRSFPEIGEKSGIALPASYGWSN